MKIKETTKYIENYIKMALDFNKKNIKYSALYIQGRPGIGKSDIISQICKNNNYSLKVVYMSILPLEKLTGLPRINNDKNSDNMWTEPDIIKFNNNNLEINNISKENNIKILLLDDAHLINKQYQSYLFELLIYRQINGYKIDDDTVIILAGNKPEDIANFQPILAPVVNRISFIELNNDVYSWAEYIQSLNIVDNSVIDFLMYNDNFFIGEPLESYPWPSPRSWTYLGQDMKYCKDNNISLKDDILTEKIKGFVGNEALVEYMKFYKLYKKWNIKNTLNNENFIKDINNEKLGHIDLFSALTKIYRDIVNIASKDYKKNKKYIDGLINSYKNVILASAQTNYKVFIPVIIKTMLIDKNNVSDMIINLALDSAETKDIVHNLLS